MEHRLSAAERDDGGPQPGQVIDPCQHRLQRDRGRHLVVLVAVAAVDVATANRDEMDQERMSGVAQAACELADRSQRTAGLPKQMLPGNDIAAEVGRGVRSGLWVFSGLTPPGVTRAAGRYICLGLLRGQIMKKWGSRLTQTLAPSKLDAEFTVSSDKRGPCADRAVRRRGVKRPSRSAESLWRFAVHRAR